MNWSNRVQLLKGSLILIVGVGGFVTWSLGTQIEGAVVAPGQVSVEARRQAIQHPDGGLVTALHVREGGNVTAGAPILTLDDTELEAQMALLTRDLTGTLARLDRLRSEVLGRQTIEYRRELQETGFVEILEDESALFIARQTTLQQAMAQLNEQKVQTDAIIAGQQRQLEATRQQLSLIRQELAMRQELLRQGLAQIASVLALQREEARLNGAVGELESAIAQSRSAIAGYEIEIVRQQATFREAAQEEIRALQPRESELREQLHLTQTRIGRLVLRAPMGGTVLGLAVHTVGGVISPGAEVAGIVPSDAPLILTVEIDPGQIDRVHAGQPARLRFPNFNARITPEVDGHVTVVSADALSDSTTGRRFYIAELAFAEGTNNTLGSVTLQPGMPVEAFIQTGARTPASFLLKPLADYWAYAMREE